MTALDRMSSGCMPFHTFADRKFDAAKPPEFMRHCIAANRVHEFFWTQDPSLISMLNNIAYKGMKPRRRVRS